MTNRYPLWKYLLMIFLFVVAVLYALPNIFGDDPAIQVSAKTGKPVETSVLPQVTNALKTNQLPYLSAAKEGDDLLVRFKDTDMQLKANDVIKNALGDDYVVAINLAPRTPRWLQALGANPMKLGLDLRGGVHLLLDVDTDAVIKARLDGDVRSMGDQLRGENIRYTNIISQPPKNIVLQFRDANSLSQANKLLGRANPDYLFMPNGLTLTATLSDPAQQKMNEYAVGQTITILNKRVDELGVSEAVVQQQGSTQVSIDLPGIQDTARAKDILGKTATLRFQLLDTTHDIQSALAGNVPFGSRLYACADESMNGNGCLNGQTLLQDQVILRGDSITYATASYSDDGRPTVQIRLGGGGESLFAQITGQNIGKPLAVVYVESKQQTQIINGKSVVTQKQTERVISIATITTALGNNFEIRGLDSEKYAQDLALLLRSGALIAPVNVIQERTVGPTLGKANINMGLRSVVVGAVLVVIFMALYYGVFGLIADVALLLNIIFIVAIMSILGATMTLPGIAGILLTVGMAVDANVLINERIREELRNGMSPQASIHAGYNRAFATIVDSNMTTLIVAVVLFALGSSVVKSFAITLTIGILTSMVTAIFFTRGIVNLIYGGRNVKRLSIGMKNVNTSRGLPGSLL